MRAAAVVGGRLRRLAATARRRPVAVLTGAAVFAAATVPIVAAITGEERATIAATVRASVTTNEGQASGSQPAISATGRFVAFVSSSSALSGSSSPQVYLRDLVDTTTRLVSVATTGGAGNGTSEAPVVSADGRFVAFTSYATNLVGADGNGKRDVFVRDLVAGTTALASVSSGGAQGNDQSYSPSIDADGSRVAFVSNATNLDPVDDLNGQHNPNVLVRDTTAGTTTLVSRHNFSVGLTHTMEPSQFSKIWLSRHALSADGRYVAFRASRNGGPFEVAPCSDTYEHRTIVVANVDAGGFVKELAFSDKGCNGVPAISADGATVAFRNRAATGWYTVAPTGGTLSEAIPSPTPSGVSDAVVSGDGTKLAFSSGASNLVAGDTNNCSDVFTISRGATLARRISVDSDGRQASNCPSGGSDAPSVSDPGYHVAFQSVARDLVGGDTNNAIDVFVRAEIPEYLTLARVLALLGPRLLNVFLVADPVNTATGNFTDTWVDLASPPNVYGLDWARTLNSRDPDTGLLGRGWSTSFAFRLTALAGGDVRLTQSDGRTVVFMSNASGGWTPPEEVLADLVSGPGGTWTLRSYGGGTAEFGADGMLAALANWDVQRVTIGRDGLGRLASATSSAGPALSFAYDLATGRLTEVAASDGRVVRYTYRADAATTLQTVALPGGQGQSYAADATGRTA